MQAVPPCDMLQKYGRLKLDHSVTTDTNGFGIDIRRGNIIPNLL